MVNLTAFKLIIDMKKNNIEQKHESKEVSELELAPEVP